MQPTMYKETDRIYQDLINNNNFIETYGLDLHRLLSFVSFIYKNDNKKINLLNKEFRKLKKMDEDSLLILKIKNEVSATIFNKSNEEETLYKLLVLSLEGKLNECAAECINKINALNNSGFKLSLEEPYRLTLSLYYSTVHTPFETVSIPIKLIQKFFKFCGAHLYALNLEKLINLENSDLDVIVKECSNITRLSIQNSKITDTTIFTKLKNLKHLSLSNCRDLPIVDLHHLLNIEKLTIKHCNALTIFNLHPDSKLEVLTLHKCNRLTSLNLSHLFRLKKLDLFNCTALTTFNLSELPKLEEFSYIGCIAVTLTENFLNFLLEKLDSVDSYMAERWANFVIDGQKKLKLHDEHPLFQKALIVRTLTDPHLIYGPKNPYCVYHYLSKVLGKEDLLPEDIEIPYESLNGQNSRLNIHFIQNEAVRKILTRSDLPPEINLETLKGLFSDFESRLSTLPFDDFIKTENYILKSFGVPLQQLKSKILGFSFVSTLLILPYDFTASIDSTTLYLCAILKAIQSKSTEIKNPDLLSTKEEMFLAFINSINNCPTGQKDGIILYYNNLEPQDKIFGWKANSKEADKIKNYIKTSYQTLLNQLFANETLINRLTGQKKESQACHQTLFLKNRFHKLVGLQHNLKFDPSTEVLNDRLLYQVKFKPKKVLIEILNYATPSKLCEIIKRDMDQLCTNQNISYLEISEYLEQIYKINKNETTMWEWLPIYLDIEENEKGDFEWRGIRQAGILAILQDMNYIEIEK